MNFKKLFPLVLLIVLAAFALSIKQCKQTVTTNPKSQTNQVATIQSRGLNRNPSSISYSKHAKCRMVCRHIDDQEINDILKNGTINYKKSELQGDDCHKKYAVEGYSNDKQHLRIIFAPCGDEITVVTCIDLGVEWACDCK